MAVFSPGRDRQKEGSLVLRDANSVTLSPIAGMLFFSLDDDTVKKLEKTRHRIETSEKKLRRIEKKIKKAPDFTGVLEHDQELATYLHNLELKILKAEEAMARAFIESVRIFRQALQDQEKRDGKKKKLDKFSEIILLLLKGALAKALAQSYKAEEEQLKKKK